MPTLPTYLTPLPKRQAPQPDPATTLSTGAIVGIAVGVVLVLLMVGLLFWCGVQRRYPDATRGRGDRRRRRRENQMMTDRGGIGLHSMGL